MNNAGITQDNLIFRMTDEDWRSALDVHLASGSFNPIHTIAEAAEQAVFRVS